jgi:hypothetical protein
MPQSCCRHDLVSYLSWQKVFACDVNADGFAHLCKIKPPSLDYAGLPTCLFGVCRRTLPRVPQPQLPQLQSWKAASSTATAMAAAALPLPLSLPLPLHPRGQPLHQLPSPDLLSPLRSRCLSLHQHLHPSHSRGALQVASSLACLACLAGKTKLDWPVWPVCYAWTDQQTYELRLAELQLDGRGVTWGG